MTNQMLIIFAIFVDHASTVSGQSLSAKQTQNAMASFSFFIFVVYLIFGTMLAVFRDDIIKPGTNTYATERTSVIPNIFPLLQLWKMRLTLAKSNLKSNHLNINKYLFTSHICLDVLGCQSIMFI